MYVCIYVCIFKNLVGSRKECFRGQKRVAGLHYWILHFCLVILSRLLLLNRGSGESRSLMNEIAHLVADKKEKLDFLRLMVVYKNSDKMVADVLGATEGITLFYYHHSMSYKYHGRLRLQNILSSIYHFMSLKHGEIPLKPLRSQEDLQNFFESTDKAILLLEFCGWSAKLLHRKNNENYETSLSVQNSSEHVDTIGENFARGADGTLAFHNAIQKGKKNEELTCGVKDGIAGSHFLGGFTLANQSALKENENGSVGSGKSCTKEEFQRFESVFMKFTAIAREHFLPPERQRFGLISQRSLLPFLGVGNPETWLIILHSSECPNCSVILQEGEDLRTILQNHYSLVIELDADGRNLEPAFPSDRPSIILFVDRSSESSKVRGESKSSLEVLRKFAWYNQISYQRVSGLDGSISKSSSGQASFGMWSRSISDALGHQTRKDNLASKIVKIKDNMAIMMVNEGEGISLKNTAPDNQGNSVYDILTHLLHQKEHALKTKETKISILAKEVGFQLLSDDFEVQVVDPLPSSENDQPKNMIKSDVTSPKDPTSELPKESVEPYVSMNDADLLDATDITTVDEGKQPEAIDMETDFQQTQKAVTYELETNKFSTKLDKKVKVDIGVFKSTQLSEDQKCCNQEEVGSFTSRDENSFHLEQKSPCAMEYIKKEQVEHTDCHSNGTSSSEVAPNLRNISSLNFSGYDVSENKKSTIISNADRLNDQHQPFVSSFFFSDGGYQLLRALTGGSKIPSLIILDPVRQQHFVFSAETEISYNSLLNFVDKFLNQSLTPYQRSALSTHSSRETPRPPFVNLDFHEADCIPRVTANTFCELVVGFESCETGNVVSFSNTESFLSAWKLDVLVLFTTSWCGFCQRMEQVVREVYRALKSFMNTPKAQAQNVDPTQIKDNKEDFALHGLPSILVMDCTLNDCSSFLKPMGETELYPALLLFPAENKSAIYYEGDMSVIDIMEFLVSHASNSHYLNRNKGFLWTHAWKRSKNRATLHDVSSLSVHEQAHYAEDQHKQLFFHAEVRGNVDHPIGSHTSGNFNDEYKHVDVGSILAATDKLINSFPFDNSTVLIVMADQKQGFQGMITNKRISWDVFKELDKDLEPLKQAPLFYGGPVMAHRMPLVSLTRKETEGYTKVVTGIYFGNPVATSLIIQQIKSGHHSAIDYWFFLGYSSWAYNQLFDELAEGAWNLSESPIEYLDWPDS
ncbi:uncharacterized protein LOC103706826 isoform X2 [Phoenix dactylifera]|uniref:Uncharacterized protein LOC103706826 isoform X2 n=1 Tax=Phoenix dactylifera TaxID=42345 RepID=A0A8B8ZMD1_PHODC|nr:uncharacterized protein LOC103706826 isoform X2 [Phoenix dactylifera]